MGLILTGHEMDVESLRIVLVQMFGEEKTAEIFRRAHPIAVSRAVKRETGSGQAAVWTHEPRAPWWTKNKEAR